MTSDIPNVLTIAGSDPSGGAGIQADLKVFGALGVYGMAALTALTAQNTQGVRAVHMTPPDFFEAQLRAIFDDIDVAAVKIGMAGSAAHIAIIVKVLEEYKPAHLVVDPVMVATSGDSLLEKDAIIALKDTLIPMADLITPNREEAFMLGCESSRDLLKLGAKASLLKGGNTKEPTCVDVLSGAAGAKAFEGRRIKTSNTHGTGCTLAAAIAANLALGMPMVKAVGDAKKYINGAIKNADLLGVGVKGVNADGNPTGAGPVHHFWDVWGRDDADEIEFKNLT